MRALFLVLSVLVVAPALALSAVAGTEPAATSLNFTVMRNGEPIGATTMRISRDGSATVADIVTHIQVKIAYITVYRYDQRETERWVGGKLVAMSSLTDDNGTVHKVSATRSGNALSVEADGKVVEVDPAVIPVSADARFGCRPRRGAAHAAGAADHRAPLFDQDQLSAGRLVRPPAPAAQGGAAR